MITSLCIGLYNITECMKGVANINKYAQEALVKKYVQELIIVHLDHIVKVHHHIGVHYSI
jgi:hypothetical protein